MSFYCYIMPCGFGNRHSYFILAKEKPFHRELHLLRYNIAATAPFIEYIHIEMHTCEIAAWILVLAIALLHGYMIYLRLQLETKLEQKPADKIFYPLRLLAFHHRYRLDPAYPDVQVYRLSRHYDRLVPYYYLSFVLIAIAVWLGMQQGC